MQRFAFKTDVKYCNSQNGTHLKGEWIPEFLHLASFVDLSVEAEW